MGEHQAKYKVPIGNDQQKIVPMTTTISLTASDNLSNN